MSNGKYRRNDDRAYAHALEHLETAKMNIDLCKNIIRKAQENSKKTKRKNDEKNNNK